MGAGIHDTKCTFYHVPEHRSCQVISQWMQVVMQSSSCGQLFTIHLSPPVVFILKCNTLYMPCWQIPHQVQHNTMSSSAGKRIPILRGLKFIILSTASSRIRWSKSRWLRLKHLVSYKISCAANEQGMQGGHQSPAYKPSYPFKFRWEWGNITCTSDNENMNVEYTVYGKYYLATSERNVNHWRGWYA